MIQEIFANIVFELKIRYRSISSYVYFLMFFVLGLVMALAAGGSFPGVTVSFGTSSKVLINAPLTIGMFIGLLTAFNLFIIAPVFGQAICKDFINNFDQIIFTTPLNIRNFLLGRFLGATVFMMFVISSVPLGIFVATQLQFILPSMLGANSWSAYTLPLFTIALPNILLFGSLFFLTGSRMRKMTSVYIAATLLFLMWSVSGQLTSDLDNRNLATLIDPIGLRSISETTRYWSVDQQNTQNLPMSSFYLWNRVLWLSIGFVALMATVFGFSRQLKKSKLNSKKTSNSPFELETASKGFIIQNLQGHEVHWSRTFCKQLSFEFSQTVKSVYFLVIVLAGVGNMLIAGSQVGKIFGTNTFPVTYNVLDFVGGTFSLFLLIIISLYVGEAVWRDRDLKISQIIDATPVPDWVLFGAKYINLILVTVVLLFAVLISGIIIQVSFGYTRFELGQYFVRLFLIELPSYVNLISLTFFLQILCRNKYLAHGLIVLFYIVDMFAATMGFEHYLYRFNAKPTPMYSDMNGYGNLFNIYHLFNTYWLSLSLLLVVISFSFWQRGTLYTSMKRWPGQMIAAAALAFISMVGLGSYLFYQTNIVNEYVTKKDLEKASQQYELKYKSFSKWPQPEITSVIAKVDLFPEEQKMKAKLNLALKNNTQEIIPKLFVNVPDENWSLTLPTPATEMRDDHLNVVIYNFETPLVPGQELKVEYTVEVDQSTIENGSNIGKLHHNGTFFNNFDYFPAIGYSDGNEITQTKTRQKYALPPRKRMPSIDNQEEYQFNYLGRSNSWIDFEATVSTSPDQIAIAPGYLQREWLENGRRYFHYKMDHKILNFYAFLSGRYEVLRDKWNDVNIEIYYHKGHEYNLERMLKATKKSLDYFTKSFGPYQHKQYRIIEFPRYQTFAQAFPNTIPFSEGIGFIARVNDANPEDVDYPFYVTSHELAHQWWAHQLIGANVQGSEMLSETFSQYSSLMVMEKEYGKEKMKKFLQYELDRYLSGRAREPEYENPLYLTESQQYIHYNKGSVIFYALRDYLGEDVVNSAIRETLEKYGKRAAPYPTALDFLKVLKGKVPQQQVSLINDMLEKIVLFENRPLTAVAQLNKDGTYAVDLTISSKKIESSPEGKEIEKDFSQEIDIGVIGQDLKYLYLKKHRIENGENKISVVVKDKPAKAGVDPLNILIDRNSKDNMVPVSFSKSL